MLYLTDQRLIEQLGRKLKAMRIAKGSSIDDFAREVNCTPDVLFQIENGVVPLAGGLPACAGSTTSAFNITVDTGTNDDSDVDLFNYEVVELKRTAVRLMSSEKLLSDVGLAERTLDEVERIFFSERAEAKQNVLYFRKGRSIKRLDVDMLEDIMQSLKTAPSSRQGR